MQFNLVHDVNVELAETPIWDNRNGCLYWTAMFEGKVGEWNPVTKMERRWDSGGKWIASAIPTKDISKLLVVMEGGAFLLDKESGKFELIAHPEPNKPQNRYNDSRVDPRGRIFISSVAKTFATPEFTEDQKGSFYMVEKDGKVTVVEEEIIQYNTMVWTADNKKMYVVDTGNALLLEWDYDLDKGPVGKFRVVLDFNKTYGTPDGMSIDEEGNLYICHLSGRISVWDKNLKLKEEVKFPVEQVCCGGFCGKDMKDFYVATAHFHYTAEQFADRRGAGGIFMARLPVAGCPDNFF